MENHLLLTFLIKERSNFGISFLVRVRTRLLLIVFFPELELGEKDANDLKDPIEPTSTDLKVGTLKSYCKDVKYFKTFSLILPESLLFTFDVSDLLLLFHYLLN